MFFSNILYNTIAFNASPPPTFPILDIQGGSVIRLFHKELEAYLVAEGLFDDDVTEDGEKTDNYNALLSVVGLLVPYVKVEDSWYLDR